eukprot:185044-Pleurochrysis_carterae.AAC.1
MQTAAYKAYTSACLTSSVRVTKWLLSDSVPEHPEIDEPFASGVLVPLLAYYRSSAVYKESMLVYCLNDIDAYLMRSGKASKADAVEAFKTASSHFVMTGEESKRPSTNTYIWRRFVRSLYDEYDKYTVNCSVAYLEAEMRACQGPNASRCTTDLLHGLKTSYSCKGVVCDWSRRRLVQRLLNAPRRLSVRELGFDAALAACGGGDGDGGDVQLWRTHVREARSLYEAGLERDRRARCLTADELGKLMRRALRVMSVVWNCAYIRNNLD